MTSHAIPGESRFARALRDYGLSRCSLGDGRLWVGLPADAAYRREALPAPPAEPRSLGFVEGPEQAELVAALAASAEVATVEALMIGTSHDYIRNPPHSYDMSAAVAALSGAKWPSLTQLTLGDMERLFNGHCYYGKVGDVGPVLAAMPKLERLLLYGQFALSAPIVHPVLQEFGASLDDIGVSGGPVSQATVTHLLSSSMPGLTGLHLSLEESDRESDYAIPEAFFAGAGFPALRSFSIDCIPAATGARLLAWKMARGID